MMDGLSFLERLGDTLHHVLPFLDAKTLCRVDSAMTNHRGRDGAWLAGIAGLTNAEAVLQEVEKHHELENAF